MTDISILKRSILWDFLNRDLPAAAGSSEDLSDGNLAAISNAMRDALKRFRFITAEIEDRSLVDAHTRTLVAEMRGPSIYDLSNVYSVSPETLIDREIKEILDEQRQSESRKNYGSAWVR
ncbi:hypothetical protein HFN89_05395 [Rhizobium laguerreae]|nr:hypothetical protein [Rhizobium laguerreae]